MDNIDLKILKFMSVRDNHTIYKKTITKNLCTKESWLLVGDMGRFFKEFPDENTIDENFKLWFRVTAHPGWKDEEHTIYGYIIDNALDLPSNNDAVFLTQLKRTKFIQGVDESFTKLRAGDLTTDEFESDIINSSISSKGGLLNSPALQSITLDSVAQNHRDNTGLYWRLEDLNRSVGPIRRGDFIVVGKRPESGGTSFLVSEMTYMLEQMPKEGKVILFNNEEAPDKVFSRIVSAAINVDYRTMMSAHTHYQKEYEKFLGGREFDLCYDTTMTIDSIHKQLRDKEYGLIGINVLLKVGGTSFSEAHDKYQALGEECRKIAQQYGPVIAIAQADPTAEGMRWIPQDRIYKSKTALQGEADVLIMIGNAGQDAPMNSRFIHVAKNKTPPAPCTVLQEKHIMSEVKFNIDTSRFTSINFKSNSRNKK